MKIAFLALGLVSYAHAIIYDCSTSIKRMKYGPADFPQIMQSNRKYEDPYFNGNDQLYWFPITKWSKILEYWWVIIAQEGGFQRLSEVYPDATMWGNNNPSWSDIMQGNAGTCYIEASMGSIAEFPTLVQDIFITKEKNEQGIYAFQFYIRGKPWLVTVDDTIFFYTDENGIRKPYHATLGRNNQMWGVLLEKAWAKLKGTYQHADGGMVENGLRALIGCPIFHYLTSESNADNAFTLLKAADGLNYVMGCGTLGASDQENNQCNVAMGHAYSLISAFELMNADGVTVDHKLYMIRNPWGESFYNQTWSDAASWTSAYRAQVPHSVDPLTSQATDGIFFVSHTDFLTCFDDYQIGHYRDGEGYSDDWYDKVNDNGRSHTYEIPVPAKNGDLYFTAESYYPLMVPIICLGGESPQVSLKLYKNDLNTLVAEKIYMEEFHWPLQVLEADYSAGDKFLFVVEFSWWYASLLPYPVKDYTVKVYSKQNLGIKDEDSKYSMWFMDGQFPSAFTKSHYRQPTTHWAPTPFEPKSLTDVFLISNNVEQFFHLCATYPHVLYIWFN